MYNNSDVMKSAEQGALTHPTSHILR